MFFTIETVTENGFDLNICDDRERKYPCNFCRQHIQLLETLCHTHITNKQLNIYTEQLNYILNTHQNQMKDGWAPLTEAKIQLIWAEAQKNKLYERILENGDFNPS